jgi:hypothetical protein
MAVGRTRRPKVVTAVRGTAGVEGYPECLLAVVDEVQLCIPAGTTWADRSVKDRRKVLSLPNDLARNAIRDSGRSIQGKDFQCPSPMA